MRGFPFFKARAVHVRILFANSVRLEEPAAEHKVFVIAFGNA